MNNLRPQYVNTQAVFDVIAERARQVEGEGWSPEHDDEHDGGEIAQAAAAYCEHAVNQDANLPGFWPWDEAWWKPRTPREDLVRAGALILAEIERIDRASDARERAQDFDRPAQLL